MGRVCVCANSQMDAGPGNLKRSSALTVVTAVWPIFSAGDQIVYVHTVDAEQCSLTSFSQNTAIRRSMACLYWPLHHNDEAIRVTTLSACIQPPRAIHKGSRSTLSPLLGRLLSFYLY